MSQTIQPYQENYLAHYGVAGMRWGKRSGSLTERAKGSALDRNARKTALAETAQKVFSKPQTKKHTALNVAAFGAYGVGPGRAVIKKTADVRLNSLAKQKVKIENGERKVRNIMQTSAAGLMVSVRPLTAS